MCDTMVATRSATADGSVILAKNSDREPNEAQFLNHFLPRKYRGGEDLRCTYITLPQAERTNEILLSRPFWMWGGEMGANNHGVVIGNEAVFTREPYEKGGLIGMDLLRLALERTKTAREALELITDLIARYGQGGNCGYRNKQFYHNSFIIADKAGAWVLETANRHWAARKIEGVASISNGLTLGEDLDLVSKGAQDYARNKGYLKKGEEFNFRLAFSDTLYTHFSRCRTRQCRTMELLERQAGRITPAIMMNFLRDHGFDSEYPTPDRTSMGTVCMHASIGPFRASQSTAALVAHLRSDMPAYWATATSGTCTGTFKPFYLTGKEMETPGDARSEGYAPHTLWWNHELLHRLAIRKYRFWHENLSFERDGLERGFTEREAKLYQAMKKKRRFDAGRLIKFSSECLRLAGETGAEWTVRLSSAPREKVPFAYGSFWKKQDRLAGLPRI